IAQAILGALVVALVWNIAVVVLPTEPWRRGVASFAALAAAFDPFSISLGAMVLSETLFTAALIAAVWFGANAARRETSWTFWSVGAGALAAVAVLARPSGLLLALIGLAAFARKRGAKQSLLAVIAFILMTTPWVLRNVVVYHAFVPTTLNVG